MCEAPNKQLISNSAVIPDLARTPDPHVGIRGRVPPPPFVTPLNRA